MWERDGSAIIYHGSYANKVSYIGKVNPDGTNLVEIALPAQWNRYGHFTVGRPGWLVTDGCYFQPEDPKRWGGSWISVLRVDWKAKTYQWMPLCLNGSSWKSQDGTRIRFSITLLMPFTSRQTRLASAPFIGRPCPSSFQGKSEFTQMRGESGCKGRRGRMPELVQPWFSAHT